VQQLRRHWRLFLPAPLAAPLPGWTKLMEVLRCVAPLRTLFALLAGLTGAATIAAGALTGHVEPVELPMIVWPLLFTGLASWAVRTSHRYRLAGCTSLSGAVRGEIARMSLTYVMLLAAVAGLSSKPLAWRRTPKFALENGRAAIFAATMPETVIGLMLLASAAGILILAETVGAGLTLLISLGLAGTALRFLAAPYMAWLAARHAASTSTATTDLPAHEPHRATA
jgi:hypothetical protein